MATPEALRRYLRPGTPLHDHLLDLLRQRATVSYNAIQCRFERWQEVERALRLYVRPEDAERLEEELPFSPRAIFVPYLYAQGKALETQYWSMLAHREHIVPVKPQGPEDVLSAMLMSMHLDWQVAQTRSLIEMWAWVKASVAFGAAAIKRRFIRRRDRVWRPIAGSVFHVEQVTYEGNELCLIDPYRMLPDPSFPFAKATSHGEFFAWTYDLGHDRLEHMRDEGWINLDSLKRRSNPFSRNDGIWLIDGRFNSARNSSIGAAEPELDFAAPTIFEGDVAHRDKGGNHVIPHRMTEFWWRVIPSELARVAREGGMPDGLVDEYFGGRKSELWTITIGDGFVINELDPTTQQVDPPIYVAEADPDMLSQFNPGPLELMLPAQIQANWLWHTHIDEKRRQVRPDILVDPFYCNLDHVLAPGGGRVIQRTKHGRDQPVENIISQVAKGDTTINNLNDMHELLDIHERLGGATPNLSGQAEKGRRTATETSRKNQAASARVQVPFEILAASGMKDLFMGMVMDTQRYMSLSTWLRVLGTTSQQLGYMEEAGAQIRSAGGNTFVQVTPGDVKGNFDLGVMDGDPDMMSATAAPLWVQAITVAQQNPMLAPQVDFRRLYVKLVRTLGIKDASELFLDRSAMPGMPPAAPPPEPEVTLVPEDDMAVIEREERAGNLVGIGMGPM